MLAPRTRRCAAAAPDLGPGALDRSGIGSTHGGRRRLGPRRRDGAAGRPGRARPAPGRGGRGRSRPARVRRGGRRAGARHLPPGSARGLGHHRGGRPAGVDPLQRRRLRRGAGPGAREDARPHRRGRRCGGGRGLARHRGADGARPGLAVGQGPRAVRGVHRPGHAAAAAARGPLDRGRRAGARRARPRLPSLGGAARGDAPGAVRRRALARRPRTVRGARSRPGHRRRRARAARPGARRRGRCGAWRLADRRGAVARAEGRARSPHGRDVAARGPRRRRDGRRRPGRGAVRAAHPGAVRQTTARARGRRRAAAPPARPRREDAPVRDGAAFVRGVVGVVGIDGFNAVWTSPDTLPTAAEIADPGAWVARVRP